MEATFEKTLKIVRENLQAGKFANAGIADEQWRSLLDRYAHFADSTDEAGFLTDSELVLTSLHTPRPYLHLMASSANAESETWGSFWDQLGGGFCCLESVLAGPMSSHLDKNYVPTAPEPQDVRSFFIHEQSNAWSMFPIPFVDESKYSDWQCRQGLDQFVLKAKRENLLSELQVCVHPNLPAETWRISIENTSDQKRSFSWFASIRVNIDSFPSYYFVPRIVCEGILEDNALVFLSHDKNNKHPRQAFFTAAPGFDAFDMMSEIYNGIGGRSFIPSAVQAGKCKNSLGLQPYAGLVAATQFKVELAPGERKTWICAYGTCPYDEAERKRYLKHVRTEALTDPQQTANSVRNIWSGHVAAHMAKTPSPELDRYFNIWSKYQNRNQARFCRALDKVGYRDVLQDLLGICNFEPGYVRKTLLHTLRYQSADGRAVRQYESCPDGGNDMRMYMDSSSWIPDTLVKYLQESGDFGLLDEEVAYFDLTTEQPDDSHRGSVYEHALRAVRSLAENTGYHGLCRIGYGDWNDALSGIGGEKGVSVWLSCACVHAARQMAQLASFLDRQDNAEKMQQIAADMTGRINEHAWDGEWYIYAINGESKPIGSKICPEGRIHLNVNTWALFTGIAGAAGRDQQVWKTVAQLATPVGHMLLTPPYTHRSRSNVGRIADQKPGLFENGSIYLHGEAFYLYALICTGQADECYRQMMQTLPACVVPDIATGPRHQQSNFTVGPDHPQFGTQLFSNFTGSVSWYRRVIEKMLGVIADFDAMIIDPRPPSDWNEYEVHKLWRNRTVYVHFRRGGPAGQRITLNGKTYEKRIPLTTLSESAVNHVDVEFA